MPQWADLDQSEARCLLPPGVRPEVSGKAPRFWTRCQPSLTTCSDLQTSPYARSEVMKVLPFGSSCCLQQLLHFTTRIASVLGEYCSRPQGLRGGYGCEMQLEQSARARALGMVRAFLFSLRNSFLGSCVQDSGRGSQSNPTVCKVGGVVL